MECNTHCSKSAVGSKAVLSHHLPITNHSLWPIRDGSRNKDTVTFDGKSRRNAWQSSRKEQEGRCAAHACGHSAAVVVAKGQCGAACRATNDINQYYLLRKASLCRRQARRRTTLTSCLLFTFMTTCRRKHYYEYNTRGSHSFRYYHKRTEPSLTPLFCVTKRFFA